MPEVLENIAAWRQEFERGWLAHVQETGQVDWNLYRHPRNESAPSGKGVRLADSRLLFVTTSGAYLKTSQKPFDTIDLLGDYSLRHLPLSAPSSEYGYAHGHYDDSLIRQDVETGIPLEHLSDLVQAGRIGSLIDPVISFMGYQPNSAQVVTDLAPPMLALAKELGADAALFAPL